MLTRLEVDNFKNLRKFSLDFGPFTCIAGPNGIGKSNIFDAIQLLSFLTDHTILEAALKLRGTNSDSADLRDLFWTDGIIRARTFRISAEMIIDPNVKDDFGREISASSTFLKYEVTIGLQETPSLGKLGGLTLVNESLNYITEREAAKKLRFPHSASKFRRSSVENKRRASGYITTQTSYDDHTEILVHQDGGSSGKPQKAAAESAPRTIIGTSNTSATPTILAARREMQKWRILALEPTSMRRADRFQDDPHVTESGDHLPATLFRLANSYPAESPESTYAAIATKLSQLVPIRSLKVEKDDVRQLLILMVKEKTGVSLPARSLSDGTLRFLALCILTEDPEADGLICMEEPENGIHPAKISAMVELLKEFSVDPDETVSPENPLRQIVIATHSPFLVQLQNEEDLVSAVEVTVKDDDGKPTKTMRCKPLSGTWRCDEEEKGIGRGSILAYLTTPPDAQIQLI